MVKKGRVVGVSVGVTKNLGNFESLRLDAWLQVEVEDGKDIKKEYKKLWEEVSNEIGEQLESAVKELKGGKDL